MNRSRLTGPKKLVRVLRRVEPAARDPLAAAIREGLEAIKWDAVARAPVDSGDLARSIDYIQSRDGLSGAVGPAAKSMSIVKRSTKSGFATAAIGKLKLNERNKDRLWQFFKGYWVEFGTKGSAKRNIPPQAARPFMRPAWDANRAWMTERVRAAIRNALEIARRG